MEPKPRMFTVIDTYSGTDEPRRDLPHDLPHDIGDDDHEGLPGPALVWAIAFGLVLCGAVVATGGAFVVAHFLDAHIEAHEQEGE